MATIDSDYKLGRSDFEDKIKDELQNSTVANIGPSALTILKDINFHHLDYSPFINGYYYIYMQNGTWVDYFDGNKNNLVSSLNITAAQLNEISEHSGQLIFNSDLPNILMETESVSGRLRNLSYATKMQINGDFSVSYHDTANLKMMKYHMSWLKFIESLRRGDIPLMEADAPDGNFNNPFIKMPYYNAMWVLIFKPFSVQPMAIFKLMGITPISAPIQQLLGDRGSPAIGTFNQTYKCNDVIFDILYSDDSSQSFSYNVAETNSVYTKLLNEFNNLFKSRNTAVTKTQGKTAFN
jgi:hypothetical protein